MHRDDRQHDDEDRAAGQEAGDAAATRVTEEVERARDGVFRAYVEARERAREVGGLHFEPDRS